MEHQDTTITPAKAAPTIRKVALNRAIDWLAGGFTMFTKAPGPWLLAALAFLVGSWILGRFGWLGSMLSTMFAIVANGVLVRACQSQEAGQDITARVQETLSLTPLWILALIGAGLSLAMGVILGVLGLGSLAVGMAGSAAFGGALGLTALVMLALGFVLAAALWLAPALVVLKGVNPVDAIRLSLTASLRNIGTYIVFSLLAMLACVLGALLLGVGLLVVVPVLVGATYLAYQDMFASASAQEGVGYTPD